MTKLAPKPAEYVEAPLIDECPVNIECQVVDKMRPGTQITFAGKALTVHLKEGIFNGKSLDLEKAPTIGYPFTGYKGVGKLLKER